MADQVDSTSTESAAFSSAVVVHRGWATQVRDYLGLIRFSHTVFALPFALLACVWAIAVPVAGRSLLETLSISTIVVRVIAVLLCMVSARSAAMAFNRLVDAKLDAANPRTAGRHIPAGILRAGDVWWFFAGNVVVFLVACGLFWPNWLPLVASVPVLAWICGYSLAKRFTAAAHLWLGVALALSPICAWVAIRGEAVLVDPTDLFPAFGLALAIALWVAGFDIIYACQDADYDREQGLHSVPARLGIAGALRLAAGLHVAMLLCLIGLPFGFPQLSLAGLYWTAFAVVGSLVIWQHAIVSPHDLQRVNIAFFNMNALISFGLSLLAAIDACLR